MIEMAVVLVIFGLLMSFFMGASSVFLSNKSREMTRSSIQAVDAALALFVSTNGRLPCPADGTIATGAAGAGVSLPAAAGECTLNQNDGVVPWVTLGIPEVEAEDGWNTRLTYRVFSAANGLTIANGMNMSSCDPAGRGTVAVPTTQACDSNCTSGDLETCTPPALFVANKGLRIEDVAGNILMDPASNTGAAYVIISHGSDGGGGYSNQGVVSAGNGTAAGTREALNVNNRDVQATYIDNEVNHGVSVSHFDDLVSRPSISSVAYRAYLAPRNH